MPARQQHPLRDPHLARYLSASCFEDREQDKRIPLQNFVKLPLLPLFVLAHERISRMARIGHDFLYDALGTDAL